METTPPAAAKRTPSGVCASRIRASGFATCAARDGSGYHGQASPPLRLKASLQGSRLMALLEIKNLHVALEDGTEIVKGVDLAVDQNEMHAIMGPNGSGKSTLAYALMGHPAYEITEGEILFDGEDSCRARRRRARAARPLPRVPVPARDPGRHRDELPAQRDQRDPQGARRRRGRPDPDPGVPQGAARRDGPAEGLARARVALPERRLLGRREEARRDPADGDAEAADRRARRDRLGARHRRAADRRRRRQGARRPRDGRARDHALPADPQLHHARFRPRVRRRAYRGRRRPRARAQARGRGLRAFIPEKAAA